MTPPTCTDLQWRGGWREDRVVERCTFPIAPRNTWSNVAYPLAGVALLLIRLEPATRAMALALLFLGAGSAVYHGTKRGFANRLDHAGMYAVFGALVIHAIVPGHPWAADLMAGMGLPLGAILAFRVRLDVTVQMGLALGVAALPSFLLGNRGLVFASLVAFLAAYACWTLDRNASPAVGLWGHALWHGLTAVAIALLFLAVP